MSLKEAQQFVAQFVTGDYTPEEYATFLQWLRGATLDELNTIADEHEALQDSWPLSATAPFPEWVEMLEGKLDEFDKIRYRAPSGLDKTPNRYAGTGGMGNVGTRFVIHPRVWVAAASIVVLSMGTAVYLRRTRENQGVPVNEPGSTTAAFLQTAENAAGKGQKQVLLADGSSVWLNAASRLKYPAAFTKSERVVELSGEAYFDVAQSAGTPFKVLIKDAEVEVLGTHFDIMAYENEPTSKTTLIDGAVRLKTGGKPFELKPGEQALVIYPAGGLAGAAGSPGEATVEVKKVDADNALDWRSGYIDFTNADMQTVMRALKRYYNVEIQYPEVISSSHTFSGGLIVKDGLIHNLKILEGEFGLHFKTDGKLVTVTR